MISAIGNDESGNSLNSYLPKTATAGVIRDPNNATSICAVICDKLGDCKLVLGDMKIHGSITPELVSRIQSMQKTGRTAFDGEEGCGKIIEASH